MFIISPMSACASEEKRDRFLDYIAKIAPVTYAIEPKCHGYAWFRSAEENSTVPQQWVKGFEVYEDVQANTKTHRSSAEYKNFRAAVGTENLLEFPSDLRFWRPSMGFMKRSEEDSDTHHFFTHKQLSSVETRQYIVVDELLPDLQHKNSIIKTLSELARRAEHNPDVLSFWVLKREDKDDDPSLLIFARYINRQVWSEFEEAKGISDAWKEANRSCQSLRRTIWVDSGIGFLGR